jgi:hypothetical protein
MQKVRCRLRKLQQFVNKKFQIFSPLKEFLSPFPYGTFSLSVTKNF